MAERRLGLPVVYLALFLSGAAALVYQATWGRMLHRVFGVSDQAIATVLAAFFLGLGLGAALGGRWGTRFRRPALTYAALEAAIGAFALASLWLIPRVHGLYAAIGADAGGSALTFVRFALALALLLPPTILMGATLPVLVALIAPHRESWSTSATWLYATNTVGAMVGAGLTGLYLVPQLGTHVAIVIAALGSLAGAALVGVVWWGEQLREDAAEGRAPREGKKRSRAPESEAARASDADERAAEARLPRVMLLAAMAGVAALASEVLWTRVLRMILVGTTQAFSAMLVNYLAGIALGSALAAVLLRRGYRSELLLGGSQVLLGVLTVVAMWVTPQLPRLLVLIHGRTDMVPHELSVILSISALLLFPLALVLGTSIPLCWRLAGSSARQAPRHSGRILAANTLGGLLGSLLAGFGAVPLWGVEGSLMGVMFLHLVIGGVAFSMAAGANIVRRAVAVAAPLALGLVLLSRGPTLHLAFLLGARNDVTRALIEGPGDSWWQNVRFLEEGRNTTVTVTEVGNKLLLHNDGRQESHLLPVEPGFGAEFAALGGLPSLYAEPRQRALVIGLGAGHCATMLLAGPWEQVVVVELEEAVVRAARFMHQAYERPFPVDDPRVELVIDDARAQLVLAGEGSFDAVVSQPSHPWLAGSSALYTQEFFLEVRRALRDTGVFSLWVNLFRTESRHIASILATLSSVFPHVNAYLVTKSSLVMVASASPLEIGERARLRFDEELDMGRFLARTRIDTFGRFVASRELDAEGARRMLGTAPLILDDRPTLEFELARLASAEGVSFHDLDQLWADVPWLSPEAVAALPPGKRLDVLLDRLVRVQLRPVALERMKPLLAELDVSDAERAIFGGAIAAFRGDVDGALASFDSVAAPRAATMADQLRLQERRFRELVEHATKRKVVPDDPQALVSAALAIATDEVVGAVMPVAEASPGKRTSRSLPVLAAFSEGGCQAVLAIDPVRLAETDDEQALYLAERCALQRSAHGQAFFFSGHRTRVRSAQAIAAAEAGVEHLQTGNQALAVRRLRQALALDPGHGLAAATLASVLVGLGEPKEAQRVLLEAHAATRGLPSASHVLGAAAQLGLELPRRGGGDAEE